MVLRRILNSLGFGGVDVDTVLSTPATRPGGAFSGQVRLHAKGDVEITSVQLLLVANSGGTQLELARYPVADRLPLTGGTGHAVGFHLATPYAAPVTLVYGHPMPGVAVGVRTEVTVAQGSAKTDFDPLGMEPTEIQQAVLDALGTIGCRFVRSELRPGSPTTQAITFYAPVPQGQPVGPHIPQLAFTFAADPQGLTVVAELAGRPGPGEVHRVTEPEFRQLIAQPAQWIELVDGWVRRALDRVAALPDQDPGSFMRPPVQAGPGAPGQPRKPYAYPGQGSGGYRYGGYRGAGTMIGAGLGGAALGFLGGMIVGDMIHDAMTPDVAADAAAGDGQDPAATDAQDAGTADTYADTGYDQGQGGPDSGGGYEAGGYDPGGYDSGGFDSGFGDFGDF
ncbi:sporulation protein [Catellatospora vulcania]|uniref:sporulation protein n=1 Tax=Catellatospora vulcania TaxID=1460450 RepID=UPI0012D41906|nr:sporulation protein [Catellatospora vulcania]